MSADSLDPCKEERKELINRFWAAIPPDPEEYSRRLDQLLKTIDIRDLRELVDQIEPWSEDEEE